MTVNPASLTIDNTRDSLLTTFGKETLKDRYLLQGESYQQMFARVSAAYADDEVHAQRLYDYMSQLWFMPATPILSNGGTTRGLPISCYVNEVADSLHSIIDTWEENAYLASMGGGLGTYWGNVRGIGESVRNAGHTSGIIPFIHVMDSMTLAISQGSLRRGSAAVYVRIDHPEIEEFLEIRKPSGDFNRKSLNLHHGIFITDEFMMAVRDDIPFDLLSPVTGECTKTVDARVLFARILEMRLQTGEPYLVYEGNVARGLAEHHKRLGLRVKTSNLCAEILLPTGIDHQGEDRTAVCCLSSVNLEVYDQWKGHPQFIQDIFRFLDNILTDFIQKAPPEIRRAAYAAARERSVGLGVMGFHSYLQSRNVPFTSVASRSINKDIFKYLRSEADKASRVLAQERGACPDALEAGLLERFSYKLAIAPTASISIICGGTSACIEPIPANIYTHKTLSGNFSVRNPYLERALEALELNTESIWQSILEHEGSVQHLEMLPESLREVFKTAFEVNQNWLIQLAADRARYICQGQSLNLFLPADIDKWDLLMLHWVAWERGVKSLYYCRSKSIQRAEYAGLAVHTKFEPAVETQDYDECPVCQ